MSGAAAMTTVATVATAVTAVTIVAVTDDQGRVTAPQWLARAERVHRQLRPGLEADYAAHLGRVFADGARMCVAADGESVLGLALWRMLENTFYGRHLYVDDLVTDAARRSAGVGQALLAHLEAKARAAGCRLLALDSGTQRHDAHRFYFREGMSITSFKFNKTLE